MDNINSSRMSFRPSTGEAGTRLQPEVLKARLIQMAEETVDSLYKIWKVAGYEEIECQRLLGDLLSKLQTVCINEVLAEEKILEHAKMQVDAHIEELRTLNEQLGRSVSVTHTNEMNYTDKLTELERMLSEVTVEVNGRQSLIDKEMNGILNLVKELGETGPTESSFQGPAGTPLLSDTRLNLMKDYKKELEQLKVKRIEEIQSLARDCYSHMSDLMYAEEGFNTMTDSSQFVSLDKQIIKFVKTSDFTLTISKKDVTTLTLRLKRFLEEKEKRRYELETTGEEIAKLWSLLRIPSVEREQFQNSFKKNLSMETIQKGFDELKRLKEIRRRSLGRVVSSIRNDILTLWDEAGIDNEENRQREFPTYYHEIETLDDSAVDLHESYFLSLRKRVEELKPILIKISRRETVIQERVELEHLQMNPERLTARGPNAREERKREESMATRVKNLDKLTKEIVSQIQVWEETNGPFMYGVSDKNNTLFKNIS
jgi:NADH:ubiquinone oxidoreductase subunit C